MNIEIEMIIAITFISIVLLGLGISMYMSRRNAGLKKQIELTKSQMATLQNDVRALCAGAVGLGEKMIYTEQQARKISERHELLEMRDSGGDRPYQQAIRMVQNGSNVEELISICQISRGEAELIQMMHRLDKAS